MMKALCELYRHHKSHANHTSHSNHTNPNLASITVSVLDFKHTQITNPQCVPHSRPPAATSPRAPSQPGPSAQHRFGPLQSLTADQRPLDYQRKSRNFSRNCKSRVRAPSASPKTHLLQRPLPHQQQPTFPHPQPHNRIQPPHSHPAISGHGSTSPRPHSQKQRQREA
jgi:hypothetical protein